jgi:glutamate-1-semialdehyde 2,1-aminomutase
MVLGKAVAAGLPCAVYGFGDTVAQGMVNAKLLAPEGHSGIGTTLSANMLTMAVLQASLQHLHTPQTYAQMLVGAERLTQGLVEGFRRYGLPWSLTRLGARMELQFMAAPPRRHDAPPELQPWHTVPARAGQVVLFESWLRHEVVANPAAAERVSISFNYNWF